MIINYCDYIATGHYAKIEKCGDRFLLKKPKDLSKDQTYVLFMLTQEQLKNIVFPLGDYTKPEIRELTASLNFENANTKDSQDICFVPDGDYASVISAYSGKSYPNGEFTDVNGNVLGEHRGIIRYTVGQRKGLGIRTPAEVELEDGTHRTVKFLSLTAAGMAFDPDATEDVAE
mgnify:CR=1 FL=1